MSRTSALSVGIVLPPCPSRSEILAAAASADASTLHSLWVTDRTVVGVPWLDAVTVLGTLASATHRVQLGTSVLVLPRRNPILLAHALASVNHLSDGRLIAGFGVGSPTITAAEFEIVGVDPTQRGRLSDDYLSLLRRLWAGDEVSYEGAGWRARGVATAVPSHREIPIWIGGNSSASRRRAARCGDGWLTYATSPEQFPEQWAEVASTAREIGRDESEIMPAVHLFGAIDQDSESSQHLLDDALQAALGAPLSAMADGCIWGTPDQWTARLDAWASAGVRHVNIALFTNDLVGDVNLVCEHVLANLPSI